MSSDKKIIIVKKKKGGGEGHHGGAWKVAYADFVTAMMAFFLVMWILGMDQGVKDMVEGYFSNPVGFKRAYSGGANLMSQGSSPANLNLRRAELMTREYQRRKFEEAAEDIEGNLERAGVMKGKGASVEVVVTDQGLRIELMETGEGEVFFDKASASLKPAIRSVLDLIAPELQALPNAVVVEGHTDGLPFGSTAYSNWELSVDRANSARRVLVESGLDMERIVEVRGYADRQPKNAEDTLDPRNRRISVLLPYREEPVVQEFRPVGDQALAPANLPSDHLLPLPDGEVP
jgi:chemotaxis protein MotB